MYIYLLQRSTPWETECQK